MFEILYEAQRSVDSYTEAPPGCIDVRIGAGYILCGCVEFTIGKPQDK